MSSRVVVVNYDPEEPSFFGTTVLHQLCTTNILFQVWDAEGREVRHLWATVHDGSELSIGFGSTETRAQYKLPPIESNILKVVVFG